jgi:hypothetical protein
MDAPASAKRQDCGRICSPLLGLGAMGFATINFDLTTMEWEPQ